MQAWNVIWPIALMMIMAFCQNVSFSIVSRSRNRNSVAYHRIAAIGSNVTWYITAKFLIVTQHMSWLLMVPYTVATVYGSTTGQQISMWIEKKLKLTADSHLGA